MVLTKKLEPFSIQDEKEMFIDKYQKKEATSKNKKILEKINDPQKIDYLLKYDYKTKELKKIAVAKKKDPEKKESNYKIKPKKKDKVTEPKEKEISKTEIKESEKQDSEKIDDLIKKLSKETNYVEKDTEPFIETFSFLEDKPTKKKISMDDYKVKNLYSKIDGFLKEHEKIRKKEKEKKDDSKSKSKFLIEEFDIPDIVTLKDDADGINYEKEDFLEEQEDIKETEKEKGNSESVIVSTDDGISLNPIVEENMKKIDASKKKNVDTDVLTADKSSNNLSINLQTPNQEISNSNQRLNDEKPMKKKDDNIDYILPSDSETGMPEKDNNFMKNKSNYSGNKNKMYGKEINQLVYNIEVDKRKKDFSEIYEKYSINDFTFVTIYYKDNNLVYNLVQPKLDPAQEKIYQEIKNIFVDSIDKNFFSFNGDAKQIRDYMEKIYDITINKLSIPLSSLDKKLYFLFIENDFSGLGFLSNVLRDENIIEINCMGAGNPINVYHIKYGIIETNLMFENLSELNVFVIELTKVMGLHVNTNNPVIDGYLQNGYKVEGLYSVGDISSRGSSFVVKKFLEKPLTPISLVNLGVGASDIFTYVWSAISNNYHVIITGSCDTSVLLNAVTLFYPDKEIITIQPHDNLKLPHKKWIKRKSTTSAIRLKTLLDQSISEKPDYIIVDEFSEEFFESQWYNITLMTADLKIKPKIIEKIKLIGQKTIVIDLKRVNVGKQEYIQIYEINEYVSGKEYNVVKLNEDNFSFRINLLSSNINIVDYKERKNIFNWMLKTNISEYRDFNNIIDDYYKNSKKLLEKLDIKEQHE